MGVWEKIIEFVYKKSSATSAYEMIDGYVSAPGGRSDEDVRAETHSFTGGVTDDEKGNVVDKLIAGAKRKREKAAKQRAEGKADLADRTEQQARSLEVAADEVNKGLPKGEQRQVKIGGDGKVSSDEKTEGPHTLLRPSVLVPAGILAVALVVVVAIVASGGDDDGDFPEEASTPVIDPSVSEQAVASGTFVVSGDGYDLSGPYIAAMGTPTCDGYGANGNDGFYNVPTPGYRDDVSYPFEVYVDLGIPDYAGPGTYSGSQLGGGVDVIELDGGGPASRSNGNPEWIVTTQADGSGKATFSGRNDRSPLSDGQDHTVSGSMSWTCEEVKLDHNYVLGHAQSG